MKRKRDWSEDGPSSRTRSKRHRGTPFLALKFLGKKVCRPLVFATTTKNYSINDPLIDYLELKQGESKERGFSLKIPQFKEFIMNKGCEYEREVINYIHTHKVPIISVSERYSKEGVNETIKLIKAGTPIIHSAPLHNQYNNTGGIADLLVRSDYLSLLCDQNPLTPEEVKIPTPKVGLPYHYVVIDIKFSTLPLCSDGIHLRNEGFYKAYKTQLFIYNKALGYIQGYTPTKAFLLGRRWKYTRKGIENRGYSCLDRLGVVDYKGWDEKYEQLTKEAIQWVRDIRIHSDNWSLDPPTRDELYPNMCIDSGEWNSRKVEIAERLGDITQIWYCGVKQRQKAFENGVRTWRDTRCTSRILGIGGGRASTIDKIMEINRQDTLKILPEKMKDGDWQTSHPMELFVDFETMSDIFTPTSQVPFQKPAPFGIFMIGVGWNDVEGEWHYKNFICEHPTREEELRIMNDFVNFVRSMGNPPLYYWNAEKRFWKSAENRQYENAVTHYEKWVSTHLDLTDWRDLHLVFKNEPIVIKGCYNYGLKNVAKSMREHGMISTRMESECDSGMYAMVQAYRVYESSSDPPSSPVMKDISKYNEWDCRVLYDILDYLRKNHT